MDLGSRPVDIADLHDKRDRLEARENIPRHHVGGEQECVVVDLERQDRKDILVGQRRVGAVAGEDEAAPTTVCGGDLHAELPRSREGCGALKERCGVLQGRHGRGHVGTRVARVACQGGNRRREEIVRELVARVDIRKEPDAAEALVEPEEGPTKHRLGLEQFSLRDICDALLCRVEAELCHHMSE